jgi:hypothetical protein
MTEDALRPGSVLFLHGRWWLVDSVEPQGAEVAARVIAKPARYRLRLRHPSGREEIGAYRRFRPDAPRFGHGFSTVEDGHPVSWEVTDERLGHDEEGDPFLDLIAERDYEELEQLPDHELEHQLSRRGLELPEAAEAMFGRAQEEGLSVEIAALEPNEAADWEEARRFIDALILEEIEDDLVEQCGVDPEHDPRESWLATIKGCLHQDLDRLVADLEGDHDEIEEWDFLGGRVFASIGTQADESDPYSGHGWLCRLLDAGALAAANFSRVRKADFTPAP